MINNPFIFKVVTLYFTDAVSVETDERIELVFGMEAGCFVLCVCVCVCVMMRPGNRTGPALTIGLPGLTINHPRLIVTIIYTDIFENKQKYSTTPGRT